MQTSLPKGETLPATVDDLQAYLDAHHIHARLHRNVGHTPTVPAAAQVLGVHADQIVKTLLFIVELPAEAHQQSPLQSVVVISHGERLIDKRALAQHFAVGRKRVRLAPPASVLAQLGYPAGGVPPFGHRTRLPILVDASLLALPAHFGARIFAGGGDDKTMLELTIPELLRVTEPSIITLSTNPLEGYRDQGPK